MICQKCKVENQGGNFCSNCGAALKEKCHECGKMEKIGRKICETKLAEARKRLWEYQRQKVGTWRLSLVVFGAVFNGMAVAGSFIYTWGVYVSASPLLILPIMGPMGWERMLPIDFSLVASAIWLVSKNVNWHFGALEKAKEEFLRSNSQEAELLKKAEG